MRKGHRPIFGEIVACRTWGSAFAGLRRGRALTDDLMTDRRDPKHPSDNREERLRQALRANLARRKAQARARAAGENNDKTIPDADGETGKDS